MSRYEVTYLSEIRDGEQDWVDKVFSPPTSLQQRGDRKPVEGNMVYLVENKNKKKKKKLKAMIN